jgi:hypothetical protein
MGLTAGGTYVAKQDILNFQILLGAKLLLWGGLLLYYYFLIH